MKQVTQRMLKQVKGNESVSTVGTPYNTNVGVQKNPRSCYMETRAHGSEKK